MENQKLNDAACSALRSILCAKAVQEGQIGTLFLSDKPTLDYNLQYEHNCYIATVVLDYLLSAAQALEDAGI